MADARNYHYTLSFGADFGNASDGSPTLKIVASKTEITIDNQPCTICLDSVTLTRKMYEPGRIEAKVIIGKTDSAKALPGVSAVKDLFMRRLAKLTITASDKTVDEAIAKNYYVDQVNVVLSRNNGVTSLFVKLNIDSMDRRMALDKYSKAYVAKRLASDILKKEYADFGLTDKMVSADISNLRHLIYTDSSKATAEMIQPYLVQYNETFYDFLARTANRCGEFLYFEDGKLTLGLPSGDATKSVDTYDSLTVEDFSGSQLDIQAYSRDSVKDDDTIGGFNADAIDKDDAGFPDDAFPASVAYNAELVHDDLIFPMQKDNFTSYTNDLSFNAQNLTVEAAKKIVTNDAGYTGIPEMIRSFASDMAVAAIEATKSSSSTNSKGNKSYIDIFKSDSPQTDTTRTVQFATVMKDGWPTLDFYDKVRRHEEEQQRKMVRIDMGKDYASLHLGDKITITGLDGNYIVIHVVVGSPQTQTICAIPTYEDNRAEAVVPPALAGPVVRTSGPQTAFVIDNGDPKKQGRVRIAYPWQSGSEGKRQALFSAREERDKALEVLEEMKKQVKAKTARKEDLENAEKDLANKEKTVKAKANDWSKDLKSMATPWIRVVSPMATDGGGAYFLPNPGDEVLVNYDCDNIERPYVVGSVYSKNLNEPNGDHGGDMTLQSPNGQFITLASASGSKFLESMAPVLKPITSFVPAVKDALGSIDKEIAGGITMSDTYGMFKIDMSSHGRRIGIESPFGKVDINAFTGITINAPNGDVKIKGKNISIEAGNNLTVKSGTNVNYDDFSLADTIKDMLKDTIKEGLDAGLGYVDLGVLSGLKIVDCALIRCVMDTFLKPIEGTLCIKSNNYLKLEAGKGSAQVPLERYSDRWQDYKKAEKDGDKQLVFSKIAAYAKRLDEKIAKFSSDYQEAREKAYEKKEAYDWLVKHLVKDDKVDSLQDIRTEAFKLGDSEFKKYDADTNTEGLVKMESFKPENLQEKWWPGYWVSGKTFLRSPEDIKNHIRKVAEEYAEAVYKLQRVAASAKTVISEQTVKAVNKSVLGRTEDNDTKWIDTIFKAEADDIMKKMADEWKDRYGDSAGGPKDDFLSDGDKKGGKDPFVETKLYRRMALTKMLVKLNDADENKITPPAAASAVVAATMGPTAVQPQPGKFFKLSIDTTASVDESFVKKNWKEIASLGDGKESNAKKLFAFLAEFLGIDKQWKPLLDPNAPLMGWAQKVWNDKSGQIIFSNKKGTTYALNGEEIEKFEFRTENNKESLKKTLLGLGEE